MKNNFIPILILLTSIISNAQSQTKTNLEVINSLVGKSVDEANRFLPENKPVVLTIITAQPLEILKPEIVTNFSKRGRLINSSGVKFVDSVSYTLVSAQVFYSGSFADGFFGDILVEREIKISGSLEIKSDKMGTGPVQFAKSAKDTVNMNNISKIENKSIPFTQSSLPSQPFLSAFWEPMLVVGTLIATVILLFTVRSK